MSRPTTTPPQVVTVDIDERALGTLGQWPPRRDRYAKIIEDLYSRGAGLVVFNVLMSEADRAGGDGELARTLSRYPVVLPSMPHTESKNKPRQPSVAVIGDQYSNNIVQYPAIIANIPSLEGGAAGVGTVNVLPEIDGVNRRLSLLVTVDGAVYPAMSLEAIRVAVGDPTVQVKLAETGVERMRVPSAGEVATDPLGRIWADWSVQLRSYSLAELPTNFDGAIVVVGVTASGLANPVPTSRGAVYPHTVQATAIATLLNGTTIVRPDWADGAEVLMIVILGVLLIVATVLGRK